MMNRFPPRLVLPILFALLGAVLLVAPAIGQDAPPPEAAPEAAAEVAPEAGAEAAPAGEPTVEAAVDDPMQFVTVDWGEEMIEGGVTMVFLGLLSVLMIAFAVERLIVLRRNKFVPHKLTQDVKPLFLRGDYDAVIARCKKSNSTLSRVVRYMTDHRDAEPMLLAQSAGDLGARELADQEARNVPFAVIAALAPLLGLLGTMIGMIEAFKLVEVFGDEGGASMLAGSISKALITTAVGLILAIPAIALYHWFKHRLHQIAQTLESETDELFSAWFVRKNRGVEAEGKRQATATAPTPASASAPAPAKTVVKPASEGASRPTAPKADPISAKAGR